MNPIFALIEAATKAGNIALAVELANLTMMARIRQEDRR